MSARDPIEDAYLEYREHMQARPGAPPPPDKPAAPAESFRLIGKPTPRIDGAKDRHRQGPLYARSLFRRHAVRQDPALAARRGRNRLHRPGPALERPEVKAALKLKESGRVRWVGDPVACLAAVSEAAAEEALAAIKVEYKILPHVIEDTAAMADSAPRVGDAPNVAAAGQATRGDVEKGFKEADVVIERDYRTNWEVHQPTETHASVAAWDGDLLTVWDSTQAVQSVRDGLARALEMPAGKVRVLKEYMGGGFGSKLGLNDFTVAAAKLARETGRPVKITMTRRENSYCVGYRPSTRFHVRIGAKKDGTITALQMKNYNCGGVGRGDRCLEPFTDMYRIPNLKVEEFAVQLNACASRATRAPGHTQGTLALEGVMEELAAALKMDPLELRLKNYAGKSKGETGLPYSLKALDRCYRAGAEAIGWARRNKVPGAGAGPAAPRHRHGLPDLAGRRDAGHDGRS